MERGLSNKSSQSDDSDVVSSDTADKSLPQLVRPIKSYILFDIVTDYTTVTLFAVKFFCAIQYALTLVKKERLDEDFMMETNGKDMQKTRNLSE